MNGSIHNPITDQVQDVLDEVRKLMNAQFFEIVTTLYFSLDEDYEKIEAWLFEKNPIFGNLPPIYMVAGGKGDRVLKAIRNALDENVRGNA